MKLLILKPVMGKFSVSSFPGHVAIIQNEEMANEMIKGGFATADKNAIKDIEAGINPAKKETTDSKKAKKSK